MEYLNENATLPSRDEMLADSTDQLKKRLALGWPQKKGHSIAGPLQREYFDDLSKTANMESVREIFLQIYDDSTARRAEDPINYRSDVYTIIDDKHFERGSLLSKSIWLTLILNDFAFKRDFHHLSMFRFILMVNRKSHCGFNAN